MNLYFTIGTAEVDRFQRLRQGYPSVDVEDEYFGALLPCFKAIEARTGKLIGLYNWQEFRGDELSVVSEEFERKKKELEAATEPIVVNIGTEFSPDGSSKDLIYSLSPASICSMLQRSLDLIGVAKIDGKVLICKGP